MENAVFCLVIEKQKGDYKVVDINEITKIVGMPFGYVSGEESSIDSFTKLFTESELKSILKRSNTIPEEYLNGTLKIVSNQHHRLPVITKEMFSKYFEFRNNPEPFSKDSKNKIFNKYHKILEVKFKDVAFINGLLDKFNKALKNNNKAEVFQLIEMPEIDYHLIRPIYLAIMEDLSLKKENSTKNIDHLYSLNEEELNNILKLEKLNDAA